MIFFELFEFFVWKCFILLIITILHVGIGYSMMGMERQGKENYVSKFVCLIRLFFNTSVKTQSLG